MYLRPKVFQQIYMSFRIVLISTIGSDENEGVYLSVGMLLTSAMKNDIIMLMDSKQQSTIVQVASVHVYIFFSFQHVNVYVLKKFIFQQKVTSKSVKENEFLFFSLFFVLLFFCFLEITSALLSHINFSYLIPLTLKE